MNASTGHITDEARRLANRQAHEAEEARLAKQTSAATAEGMPDHSDHPGNGAD